MIRLALVLLLASTAGVAAEDHPPQITPVVDPAQTDNLDGQDVQRFCSNIADAARDRRYAIQTAELKALQDDIDKRVELLETKRAEYQDWLKRRDDFIAKAEEGVVQIYKRMKPEAAAERMTDLDPQLAASILMKMETKTAGLIMNEMKSKTAAMLTGIMAASARKVDPS